jgi:hypothetical protein
VVLETWRIHYKITNERRIFVGFTTNERYVRLKHLQLAHYPENEFLTETWSYQLS